MHGYMIGSIPVYPHQSTCPKARGQLARFYSDERLLMQMLLRESGVPDDLPLDMDGYLSMYGDGQECDPSHSVAYNYCRRFLEYCQKHHRSPKDGFMIRGDLGTGKTTLQVALARSLVQCGIRPYYANLPDLRAYVISHREEGAYEEWLNRLTSQRRCPVLLLDEVGQEEPTQSWVSHFLAPLVRHRHMRGMPIITCTIYTTDRLQAERWSCDGRSIDGAATIVERLTNKTAVVEIAGSSLRRPTADFLQDEEF